MKTLKGGTWKIKLSSCFHARIPDIHYSSRLLIKTQHSGLLISCKKNSFVLVLLTALLAGACSTQRTVLSVEDMSPANVSGSELAALVPDYRESIKSITGSGRAIVSEPGNSDRVTLEFLSGREASLITVRTGVGIEGGQILVDSDSLLVYNRVDGYAEKVSVNQSNLTSIGSLASLNMLSMFSYSLPAGQVRYVFEDDSRYMAVLDDETRVTVMKGSGFVESVQQQNTRAAYSRIEYEGYAEIDNFFLPRKITIFSRDGSSRATFLVKRLDVNSPLPELTIDLPDNTPIRRL